jgi:hypothetical protein
MAHFYLATANKPSAVYQSLTGNFLSESSKCLIVFKLTSFEVHTMEPEGLKAVMTVPLFARVGSGALLRIPVCFDLH